MLSLQTFRNGLKSFRVLRSATGLPCLVRASIGSKVNRSYSSMTRSFPALFVRGGTSNGLVIHRHDLPPQEEWHKVLPAAMGSPDAYGRQLNGMGGGASSTSKICVLSPSLRPDADVDFTFIQVGIKDGTLDLAGNCGNMSAAVGPMAWDEGIVNIKEAKITRHHDGKDIQQALVRIFNTNTSKVIHSRFRVAGNPPRYCQEGDYHMDGVPRTQSRITLSFLRPAGAKTGKALPTGNAVDVLKLLPDGSEIRASLVDVSNPGVFVKVEDLGIDISDVTNLVETFTPQAVEADPALKARLEAIRQAGAVKMGLDPKVESVPKVVILFPESASKDADIQCLALSMGQAHKAVPLTLALCLGAAAKIPGTLAGDLLASRGDGPSVTIGHPSGKVEIGTTMQDGEVISADLHRTARLLMKGAVMY